MIEADVFAEDDDDMLDRGLRCGVVKYVGLLWQKAPIGPIPKTALLVRPEAAVMPSPQKGTNPVVQGADRREAGAGAQRRASPNPISASSATTHASSNLSPSPPVSNEAGYPLVLVRSLMLTPRLTGFFPP
jgi:hypothetical protein